MIKPLFAIKDIRGNDLRENICNDILLLKNLYMDSFWLSDILKRNEILAPWRCVRPSRIERKHAFQNWGKCIREDTLWKWNNTILNFNPIIMTWKSKDFSNCKNPCYFSVTFSKHICIFILFVNENVNTYIKYVLILRNEYCDSQKLLAHTILLYETLENKFT